MDPIFLTNLNEAEYKELLKEMFREILKENSAGASKFPEIMDVQEASAFLRLKVNTLYEKTCRKLIPHFKKGNKLYFNRTELETWIQQGKVKTENEIESQAITYLATHKKNY